jgi:hypothetical protein
MAYLRPRRIQRSNGSTNPLLGRLYSAAALPAWPPLGTGAGAGVGLAAPDGALQAVEALPHNQLLVHLAGRPRDRRAPPRTTAGHTGPHVTSRGELQTSHEEPMKTPVSILIQLIIDRCQSSVR